MYVGHQRPTSGTTIVDVSDPAKPKHLATIDVPDGWHSHKVRVSNGVMVVNHERFGKDRPGRIRRRARHLRCVEAGRAEAHHQMDDQGRRRAPLRFRRPLRLYLADGRGLCRQYRDDPRSRRSREAAGSRALVDSRPVDRGRRGISLGQLGAAALPSSAALRRPALCQLLASRLLHPRHFRPVEAEGDFGREHLSGLSASDPYLPAHAAASCAAATSWWSPTKTWRSSGRRRRASPGSMTSPTSSVPVSIATWQVPGLDIDGSPQPPMTGCHQPSERFHGTRHSVRLVRAGPAAGRFRRSVQSARGRALSARACSRRGAAVLERRDGGLPRARLSGRPREWRRHHRNQRISPRRHTEWTT